MPCWPRPHPSCVGVWIISETTVHKVTLFCNFWSDYKSELHVINMSDGPFPKHLFSLVQSRMNCLPVHFKNDHSWTRFPVVICVVLLYVVHNLFPCRHYLTLSSSQQFSWSTYIIFNLAKLLVIAKRNYCIFFSQSCLLAGLEKEPKLHKKLAPSLHKFITFSNLNPVKVSSCQSVPLSTQQLMNLFCMYFILTYFEDWNVLCKPIN